ncbi:MAG: CDP-alcohol phosphatidyltransferase family protein [Gemmatimonadetes bacterium]|nr:CDP-alcohol phosphatidyltransferase family protein [Gemmatimonadota bacterium]HNV76903.1 CDP-alcohol phosphatidyltransferase family protein [Gemmatimonadaceae bacterium]MBK6458143.1 CDP-alcohol phosphatidyltransferase family protein [Gemmatimonadota bacterium]MBK6844383.1 CDP-alcohol phosphatidyltransferase family protein [Gemmatimonadota bacterium]MBK7832322.1 CDP-alcohol phosphatidyltransferase family protein [Gemmatimonadota bacterium]
MSLNLPNAITAARIASTPLIAALVISAGWQLRLTAWCLFIIAAVTDYFDGKLARDRNLVTNLGKLLDPLADKMLLLATLVPMYWLTRDVALWASLPKPDAWAAGATIGPVLAGARVAYPFVTPLGLVGLPFWIIAVVLGRELFMTVFRQYAAQRGVIISAIGPAKWKTTFQWIWVGAAFFWFFASSAAAEHRWTSSAWNAFAMFNGIVGVLSMIGAVALTLYSLWLYLQRYGGLLVGSGGTRGTAG